MLAKYLRRSPPSCHHLLAELLMSLPHQHQPSLYLIPPLLVPQFLSAPTKTMSTARIKGSKRSRAESLLPSSSTVSLPSSPPSDLYDRTVGLLNEWAQHYEKRKGKRRKLNKRATSKALLLEELHKEASSQPFWSVFRRLTDAARTGEPTASYALARPGNLTETSESSADEEPPADPIEIGLRAQVSDDTTTFFNPFIQHETTLYRVAAYLDDEDAVLKRVAVPFPREKAMAHRDEDGDIILSLKMIDRTQDRLRESTFNPKNLVLRAAVAPPAKKACAQMVAAASAAIAQSTNDIARAIKVIEENTAIIVKMASSAEPANPQFDPLPLFAPALPTNQAGEAGSSPTPMSTWAIETVASIHMLTRKPNAEYDKMLKSFLDGRRKGTFIRFVSGGSATRRVAFLGDQRLEDVIDISVPLPEGELDKRKKFRGVHSGYRLLHVHELPDGSVVCDPDFVKMLVSTEGGRERFVYGVEALEPDNARRWRNLIRWLSLTSYDNATPS
ncbi:hypothetical protein A1Q1_03215 [Trichosporon asahii var. asahii CBS 2479]|uniref:Uncharacterized protein n=1 Tax=Trichosporon asahii var. asahii (strain ATCC 90039 / CBS 2479 / JCM 2466 / KCTC 7840 / NBRC 103889/ NCYC 2677 / UAMH 7654) TaxID=1186058 RepID=J6ETL3_TRIAS|nr:hypothetical protein A1Q1_03215 [Trichosporon asahii var. asahii CBS 2479]EJT47909.1 hypothetical protein A1Q1_03215 [Trichosporon asahii var. asahii CBS 2479]